MRHAPLVPPQRMRHKSSMAAITGDVEENAAATAGWSYHLRAVVRTIADYATPTLPRMWRHCRRGPAVLPVLLDIARFSRWPGLLVLLGPFPRALPAGPIACGACLAAAPPFEGAPVAATPHDHRLLLRVKSTASLCGKKRRERERGFRRLCAGARFPDARVGSSSGADRRRSRQLRDFARGGAGVAAQRSETGVGSHAGGRSSRRADDKQHI